MKQISAVVLAAGMSQRMGTPKMLLPWKKSTVIATVLNNLAQAGVEEIIVVTGGDRMAVENELLSQPIVVRAIYNENFRNGEMTDSVRIGFSNLSEKSDASLIVLGDQPQVPVNIIRWLIAEYQHTDNTLVVPSYKMKRGHPWVVDRALWGDLQILSSTFTLRDFLNKHTEKIYYLAVDSPEILADLDTPEDYTLAHPEDTGET